MKTTEKKSKKRKRVQKRVAACGLKKNWDSAPVMKSLKFSQSEAAKV